MIFIIFYKGKLPLQYSLIYGLLSFFANIIGNLVINWIVIKYKKTYIIIFIISFVIGLSAIFIGISSFLRVIEFIHYGKNKRKKNFFTILL